MPCHNYVLGHFPGYVNLGRTLCCAKFFSVPAAQWNQLTPQERWSLNRAFLNGLQPPSSNRVVFSHYPSQARLGSSFYHEIRHLQAIGVRVRPVQDAYVP